jgi:hypothetical protein
VRFLDGFQRPDFLVNPGLDLLQCFGTEDIDLHNNVTLAPREIVFALQAAKLGRIGITEARMIYCLRLTFAFSELFPTIGFQITTEPSSLEDLPCAENDK